MRKLTLTVKLPLSDKYQSDYLYPSQNSSKWCHYTYLYNKTDKKIYLINTVTGNWSEGIAAEKCKKTP